MRIEEYPQCSVSGCRMAAGFQVGFVFTTHPMSKPGEPLEVMVGLYFCEHHAEHPPQSPTEFWGEEQRKFVTQALACQRLPPPDFEAAAWHFKPLPPLNPKVAN